jgi:hypothetical protein
MKKVLHLITREGDILSDQIIEGLGKDPELEQEVIRLAQKEGACEPNYSELVEKVFAADAVHVW